MRRKWPPFMIAARHWFGTMYNACLESGSHVVGTHVSLAGWLYSSDPYCTAERIINTSSTINNVETRHTTYMPPGGYFFSKILPPHTSYLY